jgi:hypothetical protein
MKNRKKKTGVIDVTVFLCVPLCNSTVQFHNSVGSRTVYAHVQRLVSVVKMATVLEGCAKEEQSSAVRYV